MAHASTTKVALCSCKPAFSMYPSTSPSRFKASDRHMWAPRLDSTTFGAKCVTLLMFLTNALVAFQV